MIPIATFNLCIVLHFGALLCHSHIAKLTGKNIPFYDMNLLNTDYCIR